MAIHDMANCSITIYRASSGLTLPGALPAAARVVVKISAGVGTVVVDGTDGGGGPISETLNYPGVGQKTTAQEYTTVTAVTPTGVTIESTTAAGAAKEEVLTLTEIAADIPARLRRHNATNKRKRWGSARSDEGPRISVDWSLLVAAGLTGPNRVANNDVIATITDDEALHWKVQHAASMHAGGTTPHHVRFEVVMVDGALTP